MARPALRPTRAQLRAALCAIALAAPTAPAQTPAGAPRGPCTDPTYRALDFWLGEWVVRTDKGQPAGRNSVTAILDGCVISEQWDDVRGANGRGVHRFDASAGRWRQTWVDNRGRTMELVGEAGDGVMRWTRQDETGAIERGELRRVSPNRLEQRGDRSTDRGATWTPLFRLVYDRAPAEIDAELLAVRDRVWRDWFAGNEPALADVLPADFIGIGPHDAEVTDRAATIAAAQAFAAGGGRLAGLTFEDTRAQRFGDVVVLYSRYEIVVEAGGERTTTGGRATEVFMWRDGRWRHPAWHLDRR
jgi:hypothetical protein